MFRLILDFAIVATLTFMALFVYSLYQEPQMLDTMYCKMATDSDFEYKTCVIFN